MKHRIGTIVLDLDGVVYLGSEPIPQAAETITSLMDLGWQILFATNNSTKTPESVAGVLRDRAGLTIDPSTIVTSGMAAGSYLNGQGLTSAYVVGSHQLEDTLRVAGISVTDHLSAEAVVVGLDRSVTYEKLDMAARAIRRGAAFVATNTDATFPTPNGQSPGAGTIVAAVSKAAGIEPVACGKPHQPMARLVSSQVAFDDVWMVGDRPETDIAFAKEAGWRSVLTLSGVTATTEDVPAPLMPDHVIGTIADLPGILTRSSENPSDEG